jgi:hypothetical protein
MPATSTHRLHSRVNFGCHDTRRNLPAVSASKRGEVIFLAKFERTYLAELTETNAEFAAGREFALDGFGRADILFMAWKQSPKDEDFSGLALKNLRLTAIEAKLKDWRKGLMQASRYRFFANRSILVLPPATTAVAVRFLATFKALNVGLWEFDPDTCRLQKHFTPRLGRPLNSKARERAVHLISSRVKLR